MEPDSYLSVDRLIEYFVNNLFLKPKARAEEVYLRYLQRWGKDFLRRRLDWTLDEDTVNASPRHLRVAYCPCQYIEEILLNKPDRPGGRCSALNYWCIKHGGCQLC